MAETQDGVGQSPQTTAWEDWQQSVAYTRSELERFLEAGLIRSDQLERLQQYYENVLAEASAERSAGASAYSGTTLTPQSTCWNCAAAAQSGNYCARCGMLMRDPMADAIRYQHHLLATAGRLHAAGLLELHQVHAIEADVERTSREQKRQLATRRLSGIEMYKLRLKARTEFESASSSEPPADEAQPGPKRVGPPPLPRGLRRNWIEVLLDPQSIQWMLATGGLLLIVGLVIYLASVGLFENRVFVAVGMGLANLAVLAGGWWLLLKTRLHLAGRAVTLLACLAMPLHLWFYHSQGLMSVDGRLWIPAVLMCGLYAASAWALKDRMFVYVLSGGVTLTGLLILSDLGLFAQIAAPSVLLMVLGLAAIHVYHVFVDDESSPFSRKHFGTAFFTSGLVLVTGSLALLLGAQLLGWFWEPFFSQLHLRSSEPPRVATVQSLKLLALGTVIAGAYGFVYSSLIVRRSPVYAYLAAGCILWAMVIAVDAFSITITSTILIGTLAGLAIPATLAQRALPTSSPFEPTLRTLGLLLVGTATLIAVVCHLRATSTFFNAAWPYEVAPGLLVAIGAVAIAARLGAWANLPRHQNTAHLHFIASAGSVLVLVAGVLWSVGLKQWSGQGPWLALVPIAYLLASKLWNDKPSARPVFVLANTAMPIVLLFTFVAALSVGPDAILPVTGQYLNLSLALTGVEVAVFYAIVATWFVRPKALFAATVALCLAVWQLFGYFALPMQSFVLAYALVGLMLLVLYRIAALDEAKRHALSVAAFASGNALLGLATAATTFSTLAALASRRGEVPDLTLPGAMFLISGIAALLTRATAWRRFHVLSVAVMVAISVVCVQKQLDLTAWQNFELFTVAAALVILIASHIAALRNPSGSSEAVSFGLPGGALLLCLPLACGMLYSRFWHTLSLPEELGLMTASVMLFVSGVLLKFRSTTLIGAFFGIAHLIILMVHAGMQAQLTLGLYLLIGGGVVFGIGLLLALLRQRLLTLPDRIRSREGIFKVLSWR